MNRTQFLREETLSGRNKAARQNMPAFDVSAEPGGIPIRKARAFQLLCEKMPLFIGPQALIVGTRTYYNFDSFTEGITRDYPPLIAYPKYVTEQEIRHFGGDYSRVNQQHYTPDYSILLENGIGGIIHGARGGVQHQPNVLDAAQLKKAQAEPEKYRDLIVRLWGVSAHFVDLPRELQDEMIARLS